MRHGGSMHFVWDTLYNSLKPKHRNPARVLSNQPKFSYTIWLFNKKNLSYVAYYKFPTPRQNSDNLTKGKTPNSLTLCTQPSNAKSKFHRICFRVQKSITNMMASVMEAILNHIQFRNVFINNENTNWTIFKWKIKLSICTCDSVYLDYISLFHYKYTFSGFFKSYFFAITESDKLCGNL
jgi:hypothetical protein